MACSSRRDRNKYVPGSDTDAEDIFTFPYIIDQETVDYIKSHGRIMFIVRGMPGTGKKSFSKILSNTYPGSDVFSADSYFTATFSTRMRSRNSLRDSHLYCHKNVLKACKKGIHPIIVCNSHVKKTEMDEYLKFASQFNYIVIMADTSHKFIVTPEILAKSNGQGLDVGYFEKRIRQWENIFPFCTGWFISQSDSHVIFNELLNILEVLQSSQKFCNKQNFNENGYLQSYYLAKELLFCVACSGTNYLNPALKRYFYSENVKKYNGQCFEIRIFSFVFTQSDILALVHLDEGMKKLIFRHQNEIDELDEPSPESADLGQIISRLDKVSIGRDENLKEYSKTIPLQKYPSSPEPCFKESVDVKTISLNNCSYIHVAKKEEKHISPGKFQESFVRIIRYLSHCDLKSNCDTGKGAYSIHFLPSDICLVNMQKTLYIQSIFTGLYV